jgi:hypothetical protein
MFIPVLLLPDRVFNSGLMLVRLVELRALLRPLWDLRVRRPVPALGIKFCL